MQTNYYISNQKQLLTDGFNASPMMFIFDKFSNLRRKTIRNHVRFNDYFATLASILNCIKGIYEEIKEDQAEKIISINKQNLKRLENLRDDLLYLQNNFVITKKTNNEYAYNLKRKKSK